MSDIFISYSRKDSLQALELAECLRSSGMEVWIDQRGIEAATSWSGEIADAIRAAKAFVLLLSAASTESPNVKKELGVATEVGCSLVPVEIERTELNRDFLYHLAGLQRVAIGDFDGIVRALAKLGISQNPLLFKEGAGGGPAQGQPPPNPRLGKAGELDVRKSLMILPFEDLSPAADNAWFADGLATELIGALSNIKALRVSDHQATKEYKRYQGSLMNYSKTMNIRYFIEGQVRKFNDQIKISISLLDIETGDHLWQDSMKGVMNDIFEIQESVALKVVEGLKVHLASDEKRKLAERGTENAEAYELYLKANEYFNRHTKEGFRLAGQLFSEAFKLDSGYAQAYQGKAHALAELYRNYDRDPALLDEVEKLCREALRLNTELFGVYNPLSQIYMYHGMLTEAEEVAKEFIRKAPQDFHSHFTLGFFYFYTGQEAKAIAPFEEALRLKPDYLESLWNIVAVCDNAQEREKCAHWAEVALPYFERHLKLHPDDEKKLVWYVNLLLWAGRTEAAHAAAMDLKSLKDGASLYQSACLFGRLGNKAEALATFRKAIMAGYKNTRLLKEFLTYDDEKEGIVTLAGTPEYEEVRGMVEKLADPEPGSR
jgi:adenylate cyclase